MASSSPLTNIGLLSLVVLIGSWLTGTVGKLLPLVILIAVAVLGSMMSADSTSTADLAVEIAKGKKLIIVDVRTDDEVKAKPPNPGSIHIPIAEFNDRMSEVPEGPIIVHCAVGMRAKRAGNALRAAGRKPVMNVTDRDAAKKAAREAEELAKKM
ncbi:conserved hypothetical protein [Perkinsus marinus ATCC 50983]|uniref:Rhodanese domain-containing protein n=1 Tax=Perkinsus marinus (strain ATCC 50983 / TXsc) TaxID=423536 RepID=C5KM33_PERM5|nr:conserved hypothetical protein [Perkinsus marinus ATCC 50983]EER14452.1 conserved hypothetical protein [Perkinsus marinus ATCC 50983]|eukprot:XP_002782657.1 conserved hypothetical protein [Perkinsus marinus ATCC 50983]